MICSQALKTPKQLGNTMDVIEYSLTNEIYKLQVFSSATEMASICRNIPAENFFVKESYLNALEASLPERVKNIYFVLFKNGDFCGIVVGQVIHGNMYESLKGGAFFGKDAKYKGFKKWFTKRLDGYYLLVGNFLMTGEYGFYYNDNILSRSAYFSLINEVVEIGRKHLKKQEKTKVAFTLVKEFFAQNNVVRTPLTTHKYTEGTVQPNMILNIRSDWKSFDDYLAAMSSKYRVRVRRAIKKGKSIEKRELTLDEVQQYETKMFNLFQQVVSGSTFDLVHLEEHYFTALKQKLQDDFKVIGYFIEGELVGFFTYFINEVNLEAHYLGYEYKLNHPTQMYLNMLYDLIKTGIYNQVSSIIFARTALEIKSSVGAEPHEMNVYMKHHNCILNYLVAPLFKYMNPVETWQQRHPFKDKKAKPATQ